MSYPLHLFRTLSTAKGNIYCPLFFLDEDIAPMPGILVCNALNKPICTEANLSPVLKEVLKEFNILKFISLKSTIKYYRTPHTIVVALEIYESYRLWKELKYAEDYVLRNNHDCIRIDFASPLPEFSVFIDVGCVDIVILFNLLGLITIDSCENHELFLSLQVAKIRSDTLSLQWLRRYCAAYIEEDQYLIFLNYPPAKVATLIQSLITYWSGHKLYYNKNWFV